MPKTARGDAVEQVPVEVGRGQNPLPHLRAAVAPIRAGLEDPGRFIETAFRSTDTELVVEMGQHHSHAIGPPMQRQRFGTNILACPFLIR